MTVATELDLETCVGCGNPFRGRSVPRWAFDQCGNLLGSTHTSCSVVDGERVLTGSITDDCETARFWGWLTYFKQSETPVDGPEWDAIRIADGPSAILTKRQDALLTSRLKRGEWGIGRILNVVAAHAELIREYRAWRETVS